MKNIIYAFLLIAVVTSCSKTHVYTETSSSVSTSAPVVNKIKLPATGSGPVNKLPDATIFRMSGNYSKNVAVTLSPDGELLYFPAPTDITADSEPIEIGEGWWLNCQGFGANSVFTRYTFAEYAALPECPTPEQLKHSIIPGAKVIEFKVLPVKLNDAMQDPSSLKQYLGSRSK